MANPVRTAESILEALAKREFKMYLQFIVNNKTKKIASAEALSRWVADEGVISPMEYIETMETEGLISRHDFYMFSLVCAQLEKWKNTPYSDIVLSCNFTRITLSEEDFIDNLLEIAGQYDFDRRKLAIEITEDAIEKNMETAMINMILLALTISSASV